MLAASLTADLTYFDELYPLQMTTTARLNGAADLPDCSPFRVGALFAFYL